MYCVQSYWHPTSERVVFRWPVFQKTRQPLQRQARCECCSSCSSVKPTQSLSKGYCPCPLSPAQLPVIPTIPIDHFIYFSLVHPTPQSEMPQSTRTAPKSQQTYGKSAGGRTASRTKKLQVYREFDEAATPAAGTNRKNEQKSALSFC